MPELPDHLLYDERRDQQQRGRQDPQARAARSPAVTASWPFVVGTAGHIDHGKTALVHALTGIDTDRLAVEKARGITTELGFAHLDLATGAGSEPTRDERGGRWAQDRLRQGARVHVGVQLQRLLAIRRGAPVELQLGLPLHADHRPEPLPAPKAASFMHLTANATST